MFFNSFASTWQPARGLEHRSVSKPQKWKLEWLQRLLWKGSFPFARPPPTNGFRPCYSKLAEKAVLLAEVREVLTTSLHRIRPRRSRVGLQLQSSLSHSMSVSPKDPKRCLVIRTFPKENRIQKPVDKLFKLLPGHQAKVNHLQETPITLSKLRVRIVLWFQQECCTAAPSAELTSQRAKPHKRSCLAGWELPTSIFQRENSDIRVYSPKAKPDRFGMCQFFLSWQSTFDPHCVHHCLKSYQGILFLVKS